MRVGLLFALLLVNAWGVASAVWFAFAVGWQTDWQIFEVAADRIAVGLSPYVELNAETHHAFRWSPLVAYAFVPVTTLPYVAWIGAHVLALAAFRNWRLAALIGVSWPFMVDVLDGGIMVFVALAAYWAYRGNRWGTAAFLGLAVLVPRPLMIPLVAWVLWRQAEWRVPFAVLVLGHATAVVATGWHVEWLARLLTSGQDMANPFNLGPSQWLGPAWIPIGVALAGVAIWRRHIGWGSLAISPYHFPQYLLMLVLEVLPSRPPRVPDRVGSGDGAQPVVGKVIRGT